MTTPRRLQAGLVAVALIGALLSVAGCASVAAGTGSIDFGTGLNKSSLTLRHATRRFGPRDSLAFVAHLSQSAGGLSVTWSVARSYAAGAEQSVFNRQVSVASPDDNTLAKVFPVPLYRLLGVSSPGKYVMRIFQGATKLAQGSFTVYAAPAAAGSRLASPSIASATATAGPATPSAVVHVPTSPPRSTALPIPTATPSAIENGVYLDSATGMQVTITKASLDENGGTYVKPDPGTMFQVFYAIVHDAGANSQDYNSDDFQVVDQIGQTFDPTMLPSAYSPMLDSGGMRAGEQRAGWVGFEIPRSTTTMTLTWDDSSTLDPPAEIGHYTVGQAGSLPDTSPPSATSAQLDLQNVWASPDDGVPGSTITVYYRVNNGTGQSQQLVLGASLYSDSVASNFFSDPPHDATVSVGPGLHTLTRQFALPAAAGGQTFDLVATLDSPGFVKLYARWRRPSYISVASS